MPVFFKPLAEHDNMNTVYFLAMFSKKVKELDNGCWVWTANRNPKGYGRVSYGGRHQLSHRLIYRLCIGPASRIDQVCHDCPAGDNPSCCNPAHLWKGSATDNMRDSEENGRNSHPGQHGSEHPQSKLTEEDVRNIRQRYKDGESGRVLSEEYKVSRPTISEIVNRKKWTHVK